MTEVQAKRKIKSNTIAQKRRRMQKNNPKNMVRTSVLVLLDGCVNGISMSFENIALFHYDDGVVI